MKDKKKIQPKINPAVNKLPPTTFAADVIAPVADINPAVKMLLPVMLPATDSAIALVLAILTVVFAVNVTLPLPVLVPTVIIVLLFATPFVPILIFLVNALPVAPEPKL